MEVGSLSPEPGRLAVERLRVGPTEVLLELRCTDVAARCPDCRACSRRVHSRYVRTLRDLPWRGTPVTARWRAPGGSGQRGVGAGVEAGAGRAAARRTLGPGGAGDAGRRAGGDQGVCRGPGPRRGFRRPAVQLKWNNGRAEGHVNRIKLIKRKMYGRANFDLLRARVLVGH